MTENQIKESKAIHDEVNMPTTDKQKQLKKEAVEFIESVKKISDYKVRALAEKMEATYEVAQPLVKVSPAVPLFIVSQGYYLAYDNGRVLFLRQKESGVSGEDYPMILKKPTDGQSAGGGNCIKYPSGDVPQGYKGYIRPQGADLTRAELDSIVLGKPTVEALLSVYDQYYNNEVNIDISKAVPVW